MFFRAIAVHLVKTVEGNNEILHGRIQPSDGFKQFLMLLRKIAPIPDRLMMKHPVPQQPYPVQPFRQGFSGANAAGHVREDRFEQPRPEFLLIPDVEKARPEPEVQFCDYACRLRLLSALDQRSLRLTDRILFRRQQKPALIGEPVFGIEPFRGGAVNAVPERNFQTLQCRV